MLKLPIQFIELEGQNIHPIISSEINGMNANWIIDTGASKTVFDINRKIDYYLLQEKDEFHSIEATENPINVKLAELKPVLFGTSEILKLKVALIDLSHINVIYKKAGAPKICGLIGSDFLLRHNAVIDYKRAILSLSL